MKTFVQQFQDIVKSNGERTALVYQNERVTYRQLDELSGRIAARLLERGAEKEKIYPIVLERGIDYIASEIGILKAGAAFSRCRWNIRRTGWTIFKKTARAIF